MGDLIIAGQRFPISHKFYNWYETGWDSTAEHCVPMRPGAPTQCTGPGAFSEKAKNRGARRYSARAPLRRYGTTPPLDAVRSVIRQFVVHHDGLMRAEQCWHVLHNERGLSCHFLIDNDGTIYQTLDLALCGFHASEFNPIAVGVELCNRGEAKGVIGKNGEYYRGTPWYDKHKVTTCKINGSKILAYDFTPEQYEAMTELARALSKVLPNLPIEYPQDLPGKQALETLPSAWGFSGYIGHYHLTRRKWDPGPFDFKRFCDKLRGTRCFPLWTGDKPPAPTDKPLIPESLDELDRQTTKLYRRNEDQAQGGFFPVGPWGDARLWHGGVHLAAPAGTPVYAPFAGRLVAARSGTSTPIGSVDFVLLRHDMTIGPSHARFFSLYMHLDPKGQPPWMGKEQWKARGKPGEVVALDEPIEAGEVIGFVGKVGPIVDGEDLMKPQIHFEIFSADELFTELENTGWEVFDGHEGGRFSTVARINDPIDRDQKDGVLSRRELLDFFTGTGDRQAMRQYVTYHVSEWTADPDWKQALALPADFRAMDPKALAALVDEQITPGLWWTEAIAEHAGLPADGFVYHYHPIRFVGWVNEKIIETANDPAAQEQTIDASETEEVQGMSSDLDEKSDESGADMVSDFDLDPELLDKKITNRHLVEGYLGEELMLEEL